MALPKIDLPIFETKLPSTGEVVKYRPFTVKEEKIMLIAKESRDPQQVVLAIKQILTNCVINKAVDDMAVFDVEYMVMMLRSKSVNNIVDFMIEDPESGEQTQLSLNIDDVKVVKSEEHTDKIKITDDYTLFMKYPNYDAYIVAFSPGSFNNPIAYYNIMVSCLDRLVSSDTVYEFKDFSKQEVEAFLEGLPAETMDKIQNFFNTMPKLRHEIPYTTKSGIKRTFVVEGTESFFI